MSDRLPYPPDTGRTHAVMVAALTPAAGVAVAEIERLREQLRLANIDAANEAAENARLRDTLESIASSPVYVDSIKAQAWQALAGRGT